MKRLSLIILVFFTVCTNGDTAQNSVGQHSALRFQCDNNYPPYEFVDEAGTLRGFNIDIINEVADIMDLDITIDPGDWTVVRRELETGLIDGLTGMYYSRRRDANVDFSIPYIINTNTVFVRKGTAIHLLGDLEGKEIIIRNGDVMHDYLLDKKINATVITAPNSEESLKLLSSGKHDCVLMAKKAGLYIIEKYGLDNLTSAGPPILPKKYCIAVKEGNLPLLSRLNEGLLALQATDRYNEIYHKWFHPKDSQSYLKLIFVYILSAASICFLMLIAVVLWNQQLHSKVAKQTEELHGSELKWRTLTEHSPDLILTVDANLKIVFTNFNPPGIDRKSLPGEYVYDYLGRKEKKRVRRILFEVVKTGKMAVFEAEYAVAGKGMRNYEARVARIDLDNQNPGLIVTSRDITKRKQVEHKLIELNDKLEQRVIERTADLSESNGELEFFTYSVSHDLRAPLRHISQFAQLLMKETGTTVNDKARHYIDSIIISSTNMSHLIDDLLRFSKLGKSSLNRVSIHTDLMVDSIIDDLTDRESGREIVWHKESLPAIEGDRAMVNQVFVNILSNALKYTRHTENTLINISARTTGDNKTEFCIRDNGPGFDMQYHDKLFGVFERLHNHKGIEGTGIGLAFVKRIIDKHDGMVRAESDPGKGAAFYFYFS